MIIVTGANSQLAQCLKLIRPEFRYFTKSELDITNVQQCTAIFSELKPITVINCAAYTLVDKAESEHDIAFLVNRDAVKNLALLSQKLNFQLVHISTDYVTSGEHPAPILESTDDLAPKTVYGQSKLAGEKAIQDNCSRYYILRTSWLYSEFGNNFLKSIHKLVREKSQIGVRYDQVGTPTYAGDLAQGICDLLTSQAPFGVYHYTNSGVTSWFDFAVAIRDKTNPDCVVNAIEPHEYPTPAERPKYSVLNTKKFCLATSKTIPYWKRSLDLCLKKLS